MNSLQSIDKKCKYCEKEFIKLTHQMVFCSAYCREKWWRGQKINKNSKRICMICNTEFISPMGNFKTCSNKCKKERKKRMGYNEYKTQHTDFENKIKHDKEYYQKNNDKIKKQVKQRHYNRIKTDPNYRLTIRLRARLNTALRKNHNISFNRVPIGCTISELKQYLQNTAIKNGYVNFDIENYNSDEFHIDHIIPCSKFNLLIEEERNKCFHYTNLQILTAVENRKKHTKIII